MKASCEGLTSGPKSPRAPEAIRGGFASCALHDSVGGVVDSTAPTMLRCGAPKPAQGTCFQPGPWLPLKTWAKDRAQAPVDLRLGRVHRPRA
jgi:hypothetical protein